MKNPSRRDSNTKLRANIRKIIVSPVPGLIYSVPEEIEDALKTRSNCARRSPHHLARRSADQCKRCYGQYQTDAQGLSSLGAITHASHMAFSVRGNDLRKVEVVSPWPSFR